MVNGPCSADGVGERELSGGMVIVGARWCFLSGGGWDEKSVSSCRRAQTAGAT
jgi:hypothetical protein